MSELIDLESVQELKEIMEDEFDLLIETFINDFEKKLDSIKGLSASTDREDIRELAHSMKGSSVNVGSAHLSELCKTLEDQAAEGNIVNSEQQIKEIESAYYQVKSLLLEV